MIDYPEKRFEMEDDNLVEILNTVGNKSKILKRVPIILSLKEHNITGIISYDEIQQRSFLYDIIMQLITFQSYNDLKLVFFLKEDELNRWKHFQMLPHVWSNIKDIRFFSDNTEEIKEISRYMEEIMKQRKENKIQDNNNKFYSPYYLIITDDYKKIEKINIVNEIVNSESNLGFGMICLANNITKLPNECKTFIEIEDGNGEMFESEMTEDSKKFFTFDNTQRIFFEKISSAISNIPIRVTNIKDLVLPNSYTFLEIRHYH